MLKFNDLTLSESQFGYVARCIDANYDLNADRLATWALRTDIDVDKLADALPAIYKELRRRRGGSGAGVSAAIGTGAGPTVARDEPTPQTAA